MASIDGLISGLSTTDMISQLMKVEAIPQTALKNKVSIQTKAVAAYQSVNSRMASLVTAAKALGSADTWGSMKATASSDAAAVTASAGAAAGSISFTVDKLATAHTVTFKDGFVAALTSPVMTGATFKVLKTDGTTVDATPTDTSLSAVVAAINGTADAAYTATTVKLGPDKYTLQLTAKTTGATAAFTGGPAGLDARGAPSGIDLLNASTIITQGDDAQLTVGTTATYTVASASNTFTNVIAGVTLTVTKKQTDTPVTVTLAPDKDGIAAKVQALVDNANVALTEIASQTKTKSGEIAAGVLVGDSAMRKLSQDILGAVSSGAGETLGSVNQVGIALDRTGKLTFDKAKFLDALTADPAKTQAFFDTHTDVAHAKATTAFNPGWDTAVGVARKLEAIGLIATEGVTLPTDLPTTPKEGVLKGLIKRKTEFIGNLNSQVAAWDVRLDLRETALKKQWSALEVALGKLQSQSSWLSGQLAGLSGNSS